MALDASTVTTQLTNFFDAIASQISNGVANAALPLIGKLTELPSGATAADPFASLKSGLLSAIATATDADAIVAAINSSNIAGVSAVKTASGGVDITISSTRQVDTGDAPLNIGSSVGAFLDLNVNAGATLNAALNATISFAADGSVSLGSATPELAVTVEADLSIDHLAAELGVAKVTVTDAATNPEFQANFGFDFSYSGAAFTATPTLTGSAGLDLTFETTDVLAGLLPDMKGNLIVNYAPAADGSFGTPTVAVSDLKVDLGSYVGIVGGVFGDLAELFNSEPLGTLVDIATEPVPVLDDIAHTVPGLLGVFDKVGGLTGGGDGIITIGDLAAFQSKEAEDILDPWYQALDIISKIRDLGTLANAGEIDFGGGTLVGGVTVPDNEPAAIVAALKTALANAGLPQEVQDFFSDIEISGLAAAAATDPSKGFTFGLFENPGDILKILLTNEPVDLVKFDVPPLALDQAAGGFFPVLGPLGFLLEGRVRAGLDVDIGYDTQGLIDNNLANGFFVTTEASTPATPAWENPELLLFLPAGALDTTLSAGAGVGFLGSSITVNGRFGFGLHAYFEAADADGKFRPGADGFDCIFEPVGGRAGVSVNVTIKIGFGPFSIKKNITLAEATLADFEVFKCPPPSVVATELAPGLATENFAPGLLLLHVGEPSFADKRLIIDEHDNTAKPIANFDAPLNESYVIGLARDQGANEINPLANPPPILVPGKLDVSAFGFTQRVDVPAIIKADFKSGNDMLVIQRDVAVNSVISGGDGFDTLIGGGGRDILRGDADDDILSGNDGVDDLFGGTGDDQLSGGKGADLMDGGDNIDTVDYSRANRDTQQGVFVTITLAGDVIGHGGEAEGDRLISIESLIGTDFADDFRAGFGVTQNLVFDGGAGGDILIGGKGEDLLLGGIGADHLNGDDALTAFGLPGFDGTSYITSWGAVDIDLQRDIQRGGDAQGDRLFSIEAVEGSINSDILLGDASANILVGSDGHDILEGRGGVDIVRGDFGNDLVYGDADGDTLDGGPGTDTLSYEHVAGPVTVDLGATQQRILGLTTFVFGSAPDNVVMTRPLEGGERGRSSFENLIGTGGGDRLTGDIGNNRIEGRDGNDIIAGDDGFDILVGGFGVDTLIGGPGIDWVHYDDSASGVTVNLRDNFGIGGTAQGDTFGRIASDLSDVENILGSTFADNLSGDSGNNIIDPNISGGLVTETVQGFGGTDTLRLDYSKFGVDIGQGVVGGFTAGRSISGSFIRSDLFFLGTLDTVNFDGIEKLDVVGTRHADTIYGGPAYDGSTLIGDKIVTGAGDDTVVSGLGADIVLAGSGDDTVTYGTDLDRIMTDQGGAVPFFLDGGRGIDTLNVSLGQATDDVVLVGAAPGKDFNGTNVTLANGAAIANFEILGNVITGQGRDMLVQDGQYDNVFRAGSAEDAIKPGLGTDFIDGGSDYTEDLEIVRPGDAGYFVINDAEKFNGNKGDRLVLDYSSLDGGVIGSVQQAPSSTFLRDSDLLAIDITTNNGTYQDHAGNVKLTFQDIERLDVTGTNHNDLLVGTYNSYLLDFGVELVPSKSTVRGADVLIGNDGDDLLIGYSGSDTLDGSRGNDILIGADPAMPTTVKYFPAGDFPAHYDIHPPNEDADQTEVDTLTGGTGADTFVLGVAEKPASSDFPNIPGGYFYGSRGDETLPNTNRAVITDFNPLEGDALQLHGEPSHYRAEEVNGETLLYHVDDSVPLDPDPQLIAELQHFTGLDLNATYIHYVGGPHGPGAEVAAAQALLDGDVDSADPGVPPMTTMVLSSFAALLGPSSSPSFSVTQANDIGTLKSMLDGGAGVTSSTLTLSGSADAFGTFTNDPFGLGKGIILSTGRVEDLPGPNTAESGGSNVMSIPINFVNIGRAGGSDIFRADLSNLGIDIRSLTIADGNTLQGGAGGIASGFDLDAVALSRIKLDSVSATTNLNDQSVLTERLDVFDFSAASLIFTPGTQRPPAGGFDNGPTLDGAANVTLVDNVQSTLGLFAFGADSGSLTLGDGGSLALQLTQPVPTNAPLYLYIGEEGLTGETVIGRIDVSPDTIEPTGDLSTDLGATGPDGDTTSLTYTFTPKPGDTAFSLDVVLFSEELPEFDGTNLTDLYSIKLNGREIGALSNGAALSIKNLVYAGSGDLVHNPVGTGPLADAIKADAFTKTLTITGAIDPGVVNTLTIELRDGRDAFLDSGLLIKDGSFKTFTLPELSAASGGDGTLPIGDCVKVTVALPTGITLTAPVDIIVTPTPTLDLGAGAGNPITLTFDPGDTSPKEICVQAAPGATPDDPAAITYEIVSDDPAIAGQQLAPEVFDLVNPPNKAPEIAPPAGEIQVAENTTAVTTVVATDPNAGQTLKYEIVGGADGDLFDINGSGQLSFKTAPDFEKPGDFGGDNVYDVVVRASDNGDPVMSDEQAFQIRVTDTADTSTLQVKFVSENAGYKNTLGWYNMQTGAGGILFGAIEADDDRRATVKPGVTTASFVVDTALVASIGFFLVPNGGGLSQNTESELSRPIKVIQLANGSWAVATVGADGNVQLDASGKPNILVGQGANVLFTETSKNAGGVDYASSKAGTQQTAATLAGDTADGPTGTLAWEDFAATRRADGTYSKPGDADYNDVVVDVKEFKGQTIIGTALGETHDGGVANDVIYGMAGNDRLNGREGDDKLDGGPGADRMAGGPGNDTYIVDDSGDVVTETSNAGSDTVLTTLASFTLPANVENLVYAGTGSFSGTGNTLANSLTGGPGGDTLSGLGGADRIAGLGGDDSLAGGDGPDTFVFGLDFGKDVVTGFRVIGSTHDFIEFDHSIFPQFATAQQLLASNQVTQVGADVTIAADLDDTLTLENVLLTALRQHPEDFIFV